MKKLIAPLWILFFSSVASSQTYTPEILSKIKKVETSLAPNIIFGETIPKLDIESRMKETGTKGLSIAVIKDYKIEWTKAYGWADEASGKKVTTNTRFQAASISKSLNSLAVLQLVQQGKLDPEADINKYLKRWKFPYDSLSGGKHINTYHLLSHTGGLSMSGFPGYATPDTLPGITQILDGKKPANTRPVRSLFAPGIKFQYSGGGTTISQLMVEDITGADYARYMEQNILKPLGMINSSFQQPPTQTSDLATGYYTDGSPVKGKYHIYPEQAAAGLWTTPTDLAKYIIECQLAVKGKSSKVINQKLMQQRMTPYVDTNAALGVFVINRGGEKYFNHNGGNEAFLCTSYGSLEGGNGVIIMVNGENFAIINEVLNSVAQVYSWNGFYQPQFRKNITLPADSMKNYLGNYLLDKDTISIIQVGNKLAIQQNRQPAQGYTIYFSDTAHFTLEEDPNAMFTILWNAAGKVDGMELSQRGSVMKMRKVE